MKVVYGTTNNNKILEMQKYFKDYDMELISLKDIGFDKEIVEDGKTFLENSLIKAKAIKHFCNENNIDYPILTDDAGLFVLAYSGLPKSPQNSCRTCLTVSLSLFSSTKRFIYFGA